MRRRRVPVATPSPVGLRFVVLFTSIQLLWFRFEGTSLLNIAYSPLITPLWPDPRRGFGVTISGESPR